MIRQPTRILIADAHPLERAGLISIVRDHLATAEFIESDSLAAMECALGPEPPMTVAAIDLSLPGLNGVLGLRRLVDMCSRTMFLAIGDAPRRETLLAALSAGAQGYLSRDLQAHEVAKAFDTVLADRIYVPPLVTEPKNGAVDEIGESYLEHLTSRQVEVMTLIVGGHSNKEIARLLAITESTVKIHVAAIFRGLGVHNRRQLIDMLGLALSTASPH